MTLLEQTPPRLSPDVLILPLEDSGRFVAKNLRKRTYLRLGEQEYFLLQQLDGVATYSAIVQSFETRFHEAISCEEVADFVKLAKDEGLVERRSSTSSDAPDSQRLSLWKRTLASARRKSAFYFRVKLVDPDSALNWLEPRTRWLFSRPLAIAAMIFGLAAILLVYSNRGVLISQFASGFGWRTLIVLWCTAILVTICHEFGHGLACKHFGGEVREMGLLWIFFTPCFYANVSDAWLFPRRGQRLLVSMAGTYVDFLIWIPAVFLWRVTQHESVVNYVAWIIVTTCGVRVAFNINPLLRLDGYYALCDLLEVHNLRRRGRDRMWEYLRWLLWSGKKPVPVEHGRALLTYGVTNWLITVAFINLLFFKLAGWLNSFMGIAGVIAAGGLFAKLTKRYFRGSLGEDFKHMFAARNKRVWFWGVAVVLLLITPVYDRAGGHFQVRPAFRQEVRAPIAGFLRKVNAQEGDRVAPGCNLFEIEVPELSSEISRKEAEIHEVEALLVKLEAGPRPEHVSDLVEKVQRATHWRDLAEGDLARARIALREELMQLELRTAQAQTEFDYRDALYSQGQSLYERGGLAGQQVLALKKQVQEAETSLHEVEAQRRAREAEGVIPFESELARRNKELADAQAALDLLKAGSHPQEINAERAHLERLKEELRHLLEKREKQKVVCPIAGTVTTPRLSEKIGQYLERGMLICVVEDLENLEAEIAVAEQDARVLVPGQPVTLKPRATPFQSIQGRVDRIAPVTAKANTLQPDDASTKQSTVTVYCRVDNREGALRTGMTGFGRISLGMRPIGWIAFTSSLRLLRTEFWL